MHTHPHIILCSCGSRNGTSCGLRGGEQIDRTSTPRELLQGWRRVGHPPLWFAPRLPPRPSPSPLPASLVTSSSVWTVELASWAGPGRAQSPHCFVLANVLLFFCIFPSQQSFSIYQNKDDLQIEAYYPRCCGNRK